MKVLILAYDFPPLVSIGGLRPYSWYKYFASFGTKATVVTVNWENTVKEDDDGSIQNSGNTLKDAPGRELIKVQRRKGFKEKLSDTLGAGKVPKLKQAITYVFSFLEFLSLNFDSNADLYYQADELLQKEKFDFIIATGKPFILFRYAHLLSKKHHTPWVADYRDSWTMNHIQGQYSLGLLGSILNIFYRLMEKKYVSSALLVTTVSPTYIRFLPDYIDSDKIKIIYNGYDDEIESLVKDIPLPKDKFIISYAGIIYPMQRLEMFLEGVNLFLKQNPVAPQDFEINFWGVKNDAPTVSRIRGFDKNLLPYIHVYDKIGYFDVMKKIRSSHLLLLLASDADSWLNAKLFDYLVLNRPVLMVGNKTNVMCAIINETQAGIVAENPVEIAQYISLRFDAGIHTQINQTINYNQYSRKNQVRVLNGLLSEKLTADKRG